MTQPELPAEFESSDSPAPVIFRNLATAILVALLLCAGAIYLPWPQQAVLAVGIVFLAWVMDRVSSSYVVTLTLTMVSMYATFRYAYWRWSMATPFLLHPILYWGKGDVVCVELLLLAETYAFVVLVLGYLQTMWPLRRSPVPLPVDPAEWPAIDLLIPTYNEPLSVVRYTALAANHIDWPADKLNVYLLDDGDREEFRAFAEEAGIGYVTRSTNAGAKAGNINAALRGMSAPLVAIFDADHIPTRSFLQLTVGWFLRDRDLGMLQTPHHFYSPDPFARNLRVSAAVPSEEELFYGVVQDGNDFWNATLFCGSCAVLRRSALNEIGGVAEQTLTEDAHTSLRLQMSGWNTAYINIPQAGGLATERLSEHVRQRVRWARGMMQILRLDNPLFARGLKAMQRLCYLNAILHFLHGVPRLIFLFAPLAYLVFGRTALPGYWAAILAYAVPHLLLSSMARSRTQGQHRHSFWNEIYETVMAPYLAVPTLLALLFPRLGSFDVTRKGGVVAKRFFDSRIALPFLLMLVCNVAGVVCAIPKLWRITAGLSNVPPKMTWALKFFAGMYDPSHRGAIVMNLVWACFNIVILGVACSVAWETQQRRQTVRMTMRLPVGVQMPNGILQTGVTADLSTGGARMIFNEPCLLRSGERVRIQFAVLDGEESLPATVVQVDGNELRAHFDALTMTEEDALTQVLYTRADTWLRWGGAREVDRPLKSLWRVVTLSFSGFGQALRSMLPRGRDDRDKGISLRSSSLKGTVVPFVLLGVGLGLTGLALAVPVRVVLAAQAEASAPAVSRMSRVPAPSVPDSPGQFDEVLPLREINNTANPVSLRGAASIGLVHFTLPQTHVVKTATLHLRYRVSPEIAQGLSLLEVSLNGAVFATIPHAPQPGDAAPRMDDALLEATLAMPAEMLVRANSISFEIAGGASDSDGAADPSARPWAQIDASSSVEVAGNLLLMQDDLAQLPSPFYDPAVTVPTAIPIAFLHQPSPKALQAAGVLASYFGMLAKERGVRFAVSVGAIPGGNAIVIAEDAGELPIALHVATLGEPVVAIRSNPSDLYSKVLIVTGDVVQAAQGMALRRDAWKGDVFPVGPQNPPTSVENDAPRWMAANTHGSHYTVLPALELFAHMGFPFTRYADLSNSTVVLPEHPGPREIELFLALLSHFGAVTGSSAVNVTVAGPDALKANASRDYLVLGTADDQPAFATLNRSMPVQIDASGLTVRHIPGWPGVLETLWRRVSTGIEPDERALAGSMPDAVIEELEWPRGSKHSVVAIALRDGSVVPAFLSAFTASPAGIADSLSVLRGDHFVSYRAGADAYRVGKVPVWNAVQVFVASYPLALLALVLLACLVLAAVMRASLRRRAWLRLRAEA